MDKGKNLPFEENELPGLLGSTVRQQFFVTSSSQGASKNVEAPSYVVCNNLEGKSKKMAGAK